MDNRSGGFGIRTFGLEIVLLLSLFGMVGELVTVELSQVHAGRLSSDVLLKRVARSHSVYYIKYKSGSVWTGSE